MFCPAIMPMVLALSSCSTRDRKSTRLNSSHDQISYAVFCLKKKKKIGSDFKRSNAFDPRYRVHGLNVMSLDEGEPLVPVNFKRTPHPVLGGSPDESFSVPAQPIRA